MFGYQMSEYDKRVYEEELREFLPSRLTDCPYAHLETGVRRRNAGKGLRVLDAHGC